MRSSAKRAGRSSSPAAYSLLADTLPKRRLSLALGISGIALALGGYILSRIPVGGIVTSFGTFEPWQMTFIIVAVLALLLAPLVFTFPEPKRRDVIAVHKPGIGETPAFIRARGRFLIGNGVLVLCSDGFLTWAPTFLVRRFD